jgi:hypothetical protein
MVAALTLPVMNGLTSSPAGAQTAPQSTNVLRLNVASAMTSKVGQNTLTGGPKAGDHVAHYKWLIQQDKTGDPNQPSGPVAANDGTISCAGGTCSLTSPSAPFIYTSGQVSPDVGVQVTGANMLPTAKIVSVTSAQKVVLSSGAYAGPAVTGTYLFSILRPDVCRPVTPGTPQGNANFPVGCTWPSIHLSAHSPVVTQGTETDWNNATTAAQPGAPANPNGFLSGVMQNAPVKGARCQLNRTNNACIKSGNQPLVTLPDGKYFVSVTSDGYEIGGTSFTIPMPADGTAGTQPFANVNVGMNPGPLTLATMKILVFDDMAPTGGAYAAETESGMVGFTATIADFSGNPVSQDYFGNPLCTTYKTDASGKTIVDAKGNPTVVKLGGQCTSTPAPLGLLTNAIGTADTSLQFTLLPGATTANLPTLPFVITLGTEQVQVTAVNNTTNTWTIVRGFNNTVAAPHAAGTSVPDPSSQPESDGLITIPNLAPGRYGASVTSPDKAWIETTTLEGAHDFDVWLTGNDSGLDTEMVAAGEPVPFVQFGFARASMVNLTNGTPTAPVGNPHNGAYASAGCRVLPTVPEGTPPVGDIGSQLTAAMQPCQGANLQPRIHPGVDGQLPTPDGSLQADSWQYPYDPHANPTAPTGSVTGNIVSMEPYVPGVGGLPGRSGSNGQAGIRPDNRPITDAWVALADLSNGDQTSIVAPAKSDGTFAINSIPDGTYSLAFWDWNQDYAFDQFNVTIAGGQVVNEGAMPLLSWFTRIDGHVFVDKNGNGIKDPGEEGVPDFLMQILNRTNNGEEQGQNVATTNDAGFYQFKEAYPLGNDLVLQFFNTRYKTTGVSCQSDNDPQQHTVLTPAVDLTTLNIIGLNGRCDIGVQPYSTDPTGNDNGGIVATAMYHSFRTEYVQEKAAPSPWDTGQPGVRFELWQPRPDPAANAKGTYLTCKAPLPTALPSLVAVVGQYNPCPNGPDSSMVRDPVPWDSTNGGQMSVYYSEHYGRPGNNPYSQPGCVPRGADGQVFDYSFQWSIQPGGDCIEAPLQGTSFGFASDGNPVDPKLFTNPNPLDPGAFTPANSPSGTPSQYNNATGSDPYPGLNKYCQDRTAADASTQPPTPLDPLYGFPSGAECGLHGIQVVDGNYGLSPPAPGDYLVHAIVPNDMFGKPLYKWATEAANNTYEGPGWVPQNPSGMMTWADFLQGKDTRATPPTFPKMPGGGYSTTESTSSPSPDAKCVGSNLPINNTNPLGQNYVANPSWVDYWLNGTPNNGATKTPPWEGQKRPLCDTKLIHVQNGQSVAPNFYMYTDVPLATTSRATRSTTSACRPTSSAPRSVRSPASATSRSVSTIGPVVRSPRSTLTTTASTKSCCRRPTHSTATQRPGPVLVCTASSATIPVSPAPRT